MSRKIASRPSIFQHTDYKKLLLTLIESDAGGGRGRRSSLAEAMNCQLSYLSRALNADAELNADQMHQAALFFGLTSQETSYALALHGEARAATPALREHFRFEQRRILSDHLKLANRVQLVQPLSEAQVAVYYSRWYYSAVHVMTGVESWQTPDALASILKLKLKTIREALVFLVSAGLVEATSGKYKITRNQIHLASDSPFADQQHVNWRVRAADIINSRDNQSLHYTSAITLSRADLPRVKEVMLSAIESVRGIVSNSGDETAAVYLLDLFEIGGPS